MSHNEFVFIGFNSRVAALNRESGEIAWQWQAPKPAFNGYVTLLLDGDPLIVSVNGYMDCLNPATGSRIWDDPTHGFGTGVASIASVRGHALAPSAVAAAQATAGVRS